MDRDFDKITELSLRDFFNTEATDFTPWLNDNINVISELLGLEVIDNQTETNVGDFRIDIIGKDAKSNTIIAIENQLERTDHGHLGQIISYAAGLNAGIMVWIAPEIRPEHEAALQWLNEKTDVRFFGVEAKVLRIGQSKPAIDFRVKVMPTNWTNEIKSITSKVSNRNQSYQQFYEELLGRYFNKHMQQRRIKALAQSWVGFGAGRSNLAFNWTFRNVNRFSVELYISTPDQEKNKEYFDKIKELTNDPEMNELSWERLNDRIASRVAVYTDGDVRQALSDETEKERLIQWGITWMDKFTKKLGPIVRKLE